MNQINLNPNSTQTCNSIIILSTYATHLYKDGALNIIIFSVYKGYYMVARRYEFYFRVTKQYLMLFLPRENKIHIFKPPCNVLFIILL